MRLRQIPLSAFLPIAALAFWTQIIPGPACWLFYRFSQAASTQSRLAPSPSRLRLAERALDFVASRRLHIVMATNLSGGVAEILISLLTSWPNVWHPANWLPDTWRSLSYPFYSLPAWWLVGRGLDALLRNVRLPLSLYLLGSALSAVFIFLLFGLTLGLQTSDRQDIVWLLSGFALWATAFGVLPLAWLRQRKNSPQKAV